MFQWAWNLEYIMSVHKKDIKSEIIDYRPVNILSNIFKIFVGFMLKCLSDLRIFSTICSKHRCGLRKGLSAQFTMHKNPQETADLVTFTGEILNGKPYFVCSVSLSSMLVKWKPAIDHKHVFRTLFTDLSKAFGFLLWALNKQTKRKLI